MKKLNRKILIIIIATILVFLMLHSLILFKAINRYNRNETFRENKFLAESIAQMLEDHPALLNQKYISSLFDMNQVKGAVVTDNRQNIYTNAVNVDITSLIGRNEIIGIRALITNESDEVIGHVIIIERDTSRSRVLVIFLIAISISVGITLLLVFIISAILYKMVTKPLKQIIDGLQKDQFIEGISDDWSELVIAHNHSKETRIQFYQEASHNMKTPLMNIQGTMEAYEDGIYSGDEIVGKVIKEVHRLKGNIDQMIRSGKAEEYRINKANWQMIDMESFLSSLSETISTDINIEYTIRGGDFKFDQQLLEIIIDNLMQNALRYTKDYIGLVYQEINGHVSIEVKDNGPGVDASFSQEMFEKYTKGKDGKTGLGLSIVKEYVEKTDGHITFKNKDGASFLLEWDMN